jgi:predicted small metal-binding protein
VNALHDTFPDSRENAIGMGTHVLTAMLSYEFRCKDVGMDCGFEVRGASSREELMEMLAVHARRAHNLTEIPEDVRSKIEAAIRKV